MGISFNGRGTGQNPTPRFFEQNYDPNADFLDEPEFESAPKTVFLKDHSRTVVTHQKSPDVGIEASVNPYRGCEHGCIYCFARPTHEYLGLSAGLDFETKIFVKEDAPTLLRQHLLSSRYQPVPITMSGVTDCFQPAERKFKITRGCLEVLAEFKNPFTIITKNFLVTRDIDLIAPMAIIRAARVFVSVTSLNPDLTAVMEPRTSRPAFRLEAIRRLSAAGIPVGVMVAPIIPGLTDHEMPAILKAAHEAGARYAGFVPVRLPFGVKDLFEEWLGKEFKDRKDKILNRIRSIRGGKLNDSNFGSRMRGEGEFANLLSAMFKRYEKEYGFNESEFELNRSAFERPGEQLKLLSTN